LIYNLRDVERKAIKGIDIKTRVRGSWFKYLHKPYNHGCNWWISKLPSIYFWLVISIFTTIKLTKIHCRRKYHYWCNHNANPCWWWGGGCRFNTSCTISYHWLTADERSSSCLLCSACLLCFSTCSTFSFFLKELTRACSSWECFSYRYNHNIYVCYKITKL